MFLRPPRALPPRYTRGGVSINQIQLDARQQERRDRMVDDTQLPSTGTQSRSRVESRRRGVGRAYRDNGRTAVAGEEDSADDGDRSEREVCHPLTRSIETLLDRVRQMRLDMDEGPRTDEINRGRHSRPDLAIMAAIRDFVAEHAGHTREKGPRNSVIYGPLRQPPLDPETNQPSLNGLTFAWDKPPSHRFNRAASLLVADHLIRDERYIELFDANDPGLLLGVARQVRVHLRHLSTIWRSQQYENSLLTTEQREEAELRRRIFQQSHAADHRRRLLIDRRGATAAYYSRPSWIGILNHVGATSMSSDDLASDEEPSVLDSAHQPVYYIIGKSWRSAEFMEFLRLLDRLANVVEKRTKLLGRASRSRQPVPVGLAVRETARPPPSKLNREFYSAEQQTAFGPYHRYHTRDVDLQAALMDIRTVVEKEGLMV